MTLRKDLSYLLLGLFSFFYFPSLVTAQATSTFPFGSVQSTSTQTIRTSTSSPQTNLLQKQLDDLTRGRLELIDTPQDIRKNAIKEYLTITTSPASPAPYEKVTINAESYLTNLDKAIISWAVNGKIGLRGIGKKSFTFTNGGPGTTTRVSLTITTNEGQTVTKDLVFNPVGVTVLWEADTYVPPFYRGKALASPQSTIRAIAIPDISNTKNALDAGNLVYAWYRDDSPEQDHSGYGKNFFSFTAPRPTQKTDIGVRVSSLTDSIASEIKISVPIVNPFILFYENHPLLGVWYNRPFGQNLSLKKQELSVSAEPFFFSNESPEDPEFKYIWTMNGSRLKNSEKNITLRNEEGKEGKSTISLTIQGIKRTFQAGKRETLIEFTKPDQVNTLF